MPERDPRWANVFASIGEPHYDIDNNWPPPGEFRQFDMSVYYDGMLYWARQIVNVEMLHAPWFNMEKTVLDKLVLEIDDRLEGR